MVLDDSREKVKQVSQLRILALFPDRYQFTTFYTIFVVFSTKRRHMIFQITFGGENQVHENPLGTAMILYLS